MTQEPENQEPHAPQIAGREKLNQLPANALPQSDRMVRRAPAEQIAYSLQLAKAIVKAAAENRGQDIMLLDLTSQTALFDFFVIASGSSRRQLAAMSNEIERVLKNEFGERRISISGYEESRWIVMDYGSVVAHLFDEETRAFYDLETLWADSQQVDISDIVAAASASMARLTD
jgi:ribosome-associated protein